MKKIYSITANSEDLVKLNGCKFCEYDIVRKIGEGDGAVYQSLFQDGGIATKKGNIAVADAVRRIFSKLLTKYEKEQGELVLKALTDLSNDSGYVFKGQKERPHVKEELIYPKQITEDGETYYFIKDGGYEIYFIMGEDGTVWKDKNGAPWAINTNKPNNKNIGTVTRFCRAVIPKENQEDCYILMDMIEDDSDGTPSADSPKTTKPLEKLSEIGEYIEGNRQVIFTGAPGTGKTFGIRQHIKQVTGKLMVDGEEIKQSEFVQFHSSYDYSDFVEGLRPVQVVDRQTQKKEVMFVRMDGIFKRFCRNIVEYNLQVLNSSRDVNHRKLLAERSIEALKEACDLGEDATQEQEQREAILAKINETKFYFVIDEINRADLGKVFGELMFGLEEAYRGVENRFPTQYANLPTYYVDPAHPEKNGFYRTDQTDETNPDCINKEDVFAKGFFVPENLYIVGSMNDIDRSVESFDFALRRRFKWIDIKANDCMHGVLTSMNKKREEEHKFDVDELFSRAKALNDVIWCKQGEGDAKKTGGQDVNLGAQFGLNEAFHIGPAYFKDYDPTDVDETWTSRIEPILREYVRGRDAKKVENFIKACRKAYTGVDEGNTDQNGQSGNFGTAATPTKDTPGTDASMDQSGVTAAKDSADEDGDKA